MVAEFEELDQITRKLKNLNKKLKKDLILASKELDKTDFIDSEI